MLSRLLQLHGRRGWLIVGGASLLAAVVIPLLNVLPKSFPLAIPDYLIPLLGKFLCFGMAAIAMDLVWGYTGILSLGHALFFSLGGYGMGMYLMRSIQGEGVYRSALPDFMVFLDWKQLPWYWRGFDHFPFAMAMVLLVPGLLALVFGWFAFRSRIKGVYLSIVTQALTYAAMLFFFQNAAGFGGNNGLTDFKRILGFSLQSPSTKLALYVITAVALVGTYLLCRFVVQSKLGPGVDGDSRRRAEGPLLRLRVNPIQGVRVDAVRDAVRAGRRRFTFPRSASSTPARCSRRTRSSWPSGWRLAGAAPWAERWSGPCS